MINFIGPPVNIEIHEKLQKIHKFCCSLKIFQETNSFNKHALILLFFRNEAGCEFLCFDHLIISRFLYIAGGTGAGGKDRRHTLNGSPTVRAHPYTRN